MRVLLSTLLLPLGLLAGCGGDDKAKPATGPGLPSQAQLKSFFSAVTSGDGDAMAKAAGITADGSPAQAYAAYIGETDTAADAAEQGSDPVAVQEVDGGFKACIAEGQCVTWSHLTGKDGELVTFDVGDVALADSIVDLSDQAPITSPGLYEVQPDHAYRLPSGVLNVTLTVTASDVPLSPEPGTYIAGDKIIKGSADAPSPARVDAGTTSPVILAFPKAKGATLDGQVTFDLELGDQKTESIGFGLADPAAS